MTDGWERMFRDEREELDFFLSEEFRGAISMIDIKVIRTFLETVVFHYEKSAPTVSTWADDLYIRLGEDTSSVRLNELITAQTLFQEDQWENPNYAANRIYHLMERLGQDTTGHLGF